MQNSIWFKKEDNNYCQVKINSKNLIVIQRFICNDIQYSSTLQANFFWEWLRDGHKTQTDMCGNSYCLTDMGDKVVLECLFENETPKLVVDKNELINIIEKWVTFCNDYKETLIQLTSVKIIG